LVSYIFHIFNPRLDCISMIFSGFPRFMLSFFSPPLNSSSFLTKLKVTHWLSYIYLFMFHISSAQEKGFVILAIK
jgi:hypothetical protein